MLKEQGKLSYKNSILFIISLVILSFYSFNAFAEPPWKFIIVGDSRSNSADDGNGVNIPILTEIVDEIVSHNVDFVLFSGDLVLGGVDQALLETELLTWRGVMQPVYDANIALYPVRGNHDVGNPAGTTAWNNVFSGDYALPANGPPNEVNLTYSVTHKNAFILALDHYVTQSRVNQTWVDAQLAANTQPHIIAFAHEPAFKVDHDDCMDDYPTERDTFWQSLQDTGARIYACGHDHFYDHALIDNNDADPTNDIHQYVAGTAGAPLRSWSPPYDGVNSSMFPTQWHHSEKYGYVLIDVTDEQMTFTWYERLDAGLYEPPIGSADFDNSGLVDANDLVIFAENWLRDNCIMENGFCNGADMDQSINSDMTDFSHFANHWKEKSFDIGVSAGSDDAEERISTGSVSLTSTDLELTHDGSNNQIIGIRFNNVPIEKDEQIDQAYIQFTVDETNNDNPCSLNIYIENSDNAATFTTATNNISGRPRIGTIVWNPPDWNEELEASLDQQTPNIASLIEQVVSRPDWSKGNSLAFIIDGTGRRTAESYDGGISLAPRLYVKME
jgi:hypothetical protein